MDNQTHYRNAVFTLNNYNDDEYNALLHNDLFIYIIIGKEKGKGGTPHLQGYFELKKPARFNKVKKINPRMYFAARKGSQKEAIAYCKKDGDFVEMGKARRQGERTDLLKLRDSMLSGKSMKRIVQENDLSYHQIKYCLVLRPYLYSNNLINKKVIWCYGDTGSGKSYYAYNYTDNKSDIYYKNPTNKWWDAYDGENIIIIDDLRSRNIDFVDLLRMTDIYPYRAEYKGGSVFLTASVIIITSPYTPQEMYGFTAENIDQLLRRIEILKFPLCVNL